MLMKSLIDIKCLAEKLIKSVQCRRYIKEEEYMFNADEIIGRYQIFSQRTC